MKIYTIEYTRRFTLKDVKRLFGILVGCSGFSIRSGEYHITKASLLIFLSLIGLKNGFTVEVFCKNDTEYNYIKEVLEKLV